MPTTSQAAVATTSQRPQRMLEARRAPARPHHGGVPSLRNLAVDEGGHPLVAQLTRQRQGLRGRADRLFLAPAAQVRRRQGEQVSRRFGMLGRAQRLEVG